MATLVMVDEGLVRLRVSGQASSPPEPEPLLSAPLRRALFLALLAEDRAEGLGERVVEARLRFVALALDEGWTTPQLARALGTRPEWVALAVVGLAVAPRA